MMPPAAWRCGISAVVFAVAGQCWGGGKVGWGYRLGDADGLALLLEQACYFEGEGLEGGGWEFGCCHFGFCGLGDVVFSGDSGGEGRGD